MNPLRLAVDTNVLLDWAGRAEDVLDALAVIDKRLPNGDKLIPPSALDELAYLCDSGSTPDTCQRARQAFQRIRDEHYFRPMLELPFAPDQAEELADEFLQRELLPREEVHDSLILAEAVVLSCGILLTSDEHLRTIDHEQLTWILNRHELATPVIATPREIVRKFFR